MACTAMYATTSYRHTSATQHAADHVYNTYIIYSTFNSLVQLLRHGVKGKKLLGAKPDINSYAGYKPPAHFSCGADSSPTPTHTMPQGVGVRFQD